MPDNKQSFFPSLLAKAEQNAQNILTGYWVDRHPLKQSRLQALCCFRLLSRVWLFNTMNCSTPGSPVFHCLPEFAQTHVHWVSDAIQPFHPLVTPFSSCPQSFPASGSFPMSWLFTSGSQSIGASALTSVLPANIQGWFPLGWLIWSPCCPRDSQESSPAP